MDLEINYTLSIILNISITGLLILSTLCTIIQSYKFFQTTTPQSLVTKYLTFYSFSLCLFYMSTFISMAVNKGDLAQYNRTWDPILIFLMTMTTFIKFIFALDLFLWFRKVAVYLRKPSLARTQNEKFIILCIIGVSFPLFYLLIWFIVMGLDFEPLYDHLGPFEFMRITRIVRVFLVCGTLWYIRSASMDRKELWSKYGLHIRLITMLGGFSAVVSIIEAFSLVFFSKDTTVITGFWVHYFGYALEGVVIAILFSFRDETFRSPSGGVSSQQATSSCTSCNC